MVKDFPTCIVVSKELSYRYHDQTGVMIFPYGRAKMGHRFSQIIVVTPPSNEQEEKWLEYLHFGLGPYDQYRTNAR